MITNKTKENISNIVFIYLFPLLNQPREQKNFIPSSIKTHSSDRLSNPWHLIFACFAYFHHYVDLGKFEKKNQINWEIPHILLSCMNEFSNWFRDSVHRKKLSTEQKIDQKTENVINISAAVSCFQSVACGTFSVFPRNSFNFHFNFFVLFRWLEIKTTTKYSMCLRTFSRHWITITNVERA